MTRIDEYAPWEALAKDEEFWAGFQKELETALSDRLLPVFMAGAYAGARLLPKRLQPEDLPAEKHYSGQHDQKRHAHGGFGSPAIGPVTELQAKNAEKWLAQNGLSRETIDANAEAFYRKATAKQTREGMGWYDGAHDYASDLATKHGVSIQTATGVLAACSPRTLWAKNKDEADAILGLVKRGTIGGPMKVGSVTGDNLDKALKIARGGDPEKILGGAKVRSFYHNILEPHASRETTIDTHMINALAGGGHPVGDVLTRAVFKRPAVYSIFAASVDRVAAKRGIRRSQVQAIIWGVQMEAVGLKALRLALKAEDDDYEEPAEGTGLYDAGDEGLSDAEYLAKLEHDMRARGETAEDIREALGDVVLYSTGRTLVQKHLSGRHDQMTHAHGGGGGEISFEPKVGPSYNKQIQAEVSPLYGGWEKSLTPAEATAVFAYTETSSSMNQYQRKGLYPSETDQRLAKEYYGSTGNVKQDCDNLASALDKASAPKTIITYRGLKGELNLKKGDEFTDDGFTSTSLNLHTAAGFGDYTPGRMSTAGRQVAKITIPKGAKAAAVNAVGRVKRNEAEIVVQRGSRYRVTKVNRTRRQSFKRMNPDDQKNFGDASMLIKTYELELIP